MVETFSHFQALTLDVIGEAAFAVRVDCQRNFNDPFYVNCREFFRVCAPQIRFKSQ